ncbi:hypothetical protein ACIBLA_23810 [Streptomyces sp. NPDC050433]|uniref:hypothetical protein n=1 Tax=Streptomyces sp. NPDC050433 TaxID=3365615 RepID=UPI0037B578A7
MSDAYSPIPELNLLKEFYDQQPCFSDGFEMYEYGQPDDVFIHWLDMAGSQDPELPGHLARLVYFAQATGSGSFYALWRCDDRADLATLPVIRFGDEGDLDVVAIGLRDLFRLLALDDEWFAPDEDEDDDRSMDHHDYVIWLRRTFGLTRPENPSTILDAASEAYGRRFADWLRQFASDDIADSVVGPSH